MGPVEGLGESFEPFLSQNHAAALALAAVHNPKGRRRMRAAFEYAGLLMLVGLVALILVRDVGMSLAALFTTIGTAL